MVIVAAAVALVATSNAFAAPPIARPNPAVVNFQVDYVSELHAADGSVASLPGLDPSVIAQAVADQQFLAYLRRDDLGGFVPAPLGQRAASSGGRNVVGAGAGRSELPQLEEAASGTVRKSR